MALVMVQGHVFDGLLTPEARAESLYRLQVIVHGSTAPGFLFASGFVAGLPRSPLSLRASLRRARRLLFILGVGYALHLPYLSLSKTILESSAAERTTLFECHALQIIAVTQLVVLLVQWIFGRRWTTATGLLALLVLIAGPFVWAGQLSARVPPALGAYLDDSTGSPFPFFPYSAFVLAGTVAGAALGRQDERVRRRRSLVWGTLLVGAGIVVALPLAGVVGFWGVSPAYALLRLGGLLLLLQFMEQEVARGRPLVRPLALLGHETLLVFVFHLYLLFGGVVAPAPMGALLGHLGFIGASVALVSMIPVLLAVAWAWHRLKVLAPHEASLALAFVTTLFVYEFLTRPW
jgi:heparan-alpha-glucosaminide N-acetyltransferase-like protein